MSRALVADPFWDLPFAEKCRFFATGRCGTRRFSLPPEQGLVERWRPTISGRGVRLAGAPEHGYLTRADALHAAQKFKAASKSHLTPHDPL